MQRYLFLLKKNHAVILTTIFLVVFCLFHIKLVSNTFYIDQDKNFHSTNEGYGDVPLHLTQISHFAFSSDLNANEPIYFGTKMNYHFFFNFIRGIILAMTDSWRVAVIWPLVLLVALNIVLLFIIYNHVLKNKYLSILSLLIFYLGPSLVWINTMFTEQDHFLTRADAIYPLQNVAFGAPMFLVFTHQHTSIFGLALFLIFLYSIIRLKDENHWFLWILSIISFGILPLSHAHSFIAAVIFASVLAVVLIVQKNYIYLKKVIYVGFCAFVISSPQILYLVINKVGNGSFIKWRLGWMIGERTGGIQFGNAKETIFSYEFLSFLGVNFGIILPLLVASLIFMYIYFRKNSIEIAKSNFYLLVFGLVGIVTFLLTQLVKFQPWDNDNNKLLVYFLLFSAPVVIWCLYRFLERWSIMRHIIILIIASMSIFTGVLYSVDRFTVPKSRLPIIFSADAIVLSEYIKSNIEENHLILTSSNHLNPVSSLAGRSVLVSYPGWLWTRGIDYGGRLAKVEQFYREPSVDAEILKEYPIGYVLIDDFAIREYAVSIEKFDKLFTKVYEKGVYVLYKVNNKTE